MHSGSLFMKKLIALILLLGCSSASAVPVTWYLNDVTFDNGVWVRGTFTYDASTNIYSDISINPPSLGNGLPYYADFSRPGCLECGFEVPNTSESAIFSGTGGNDEYFLWLQFETPLSDAGGEISLLTGPPSGIYLSQRYQVPSRLASLVSGTVSLVPVPAAAWLFASGLGLLGWFRRRVQS